MGTGHEVAHDPFGGARRRHFPALRAGKNISLCFITFPPYAKRGEVPLRRRKTPPLPALRAGKNIKSHSRRPSISLRCNASKIVSMTLLVSLRTWPFQKRSTRKPRSRRKPSRRQSYVAASRC